MLYQYEFVIDDVTKENCPHVSKCVSWRYVPVCQFIPFGEVAEAFADGGLGGEAVVFL